MNEEIINNLFEFWTYIGNKTKKLTESEGYKAVSMTLSDWPNRIFSVPDRPEILTKVMRLSQQGLLPDIITVKKPNSLENSANYQLIFGQKNMALDIKGMENSIGKNGNIHQVESTDDATDFAKTASAAFGYRVDADVVYLISEESSKIKMFNYTQNNVCIGCGIVFFDTNNNAGLHMIGTIPKERGLGLGKSMTEKLLSEAIMKGMDYCVLHASLMGETIYRRLGFIPFGEIETYRIIKKDNSV